MCVRHGEIVVQCGDVTFGEKTLHSVGFWRTLRSLATCQRCYRVKPLQNNLWAHSAKMIQRKT